MTDDEGDQRADRSRLRAASSATQTVTTDRTGIRTRGGIDPYHAGNVEHAQRVPSPARVPSNLWRLRYTAPSRALLATHPRVLSSCRRASTMLASRALPCGLPRPGDRSRHKSRRAASAMCSDSTDGVPLCCRLSSSPHSAQSVAARAINLSHKDILRRIAIRLFRLHLTRPGASMPGSGRLP